ncbi:MAG: sigma-70 family RNA polymerase sigma factor [Planctomycetaceae bacterium]
MGPPKDNTALIRGCQGLVRSIAWKIHRRVSAHVELDDLVGYGQIGLAEAVRDFDPSRGAQISTFAYYRIRGAILDGLSTMNWFNRADFSRGRYERMASELLADEPTDGNSLGEDVSWFRQVTGSLAVVYLMSQQGSTSGPPTDFADDASCVESEAELSDLSTKLNTLISDLPEDTQKLVRGVYFEGLTLKEAGERVGISKAWASRMHSKALKTLAFGLSGYA